MLTKITVAKFYKDATSFTCISNPSVKLDFAKVNDDYCDCPDGSDEPGTSACSHLSPLSPTFPQDHLDDSINVTVAIPGYYCKNKGHQPSYIPSTYVNDGKCDYELCCDGSDEWAGVGGVKCEDKCKEIGAEWRKQEEARQKALTAANKRRKELVTEAARLRKEVEDRIQTLGTETEGLEIRVKDLEKEFVDVERREKGKVVKAAGKGGKSAALIGLVRPRLDELRESLQRVRGERDSSKARLREVEAILSTFKEEYNPNFNDEGVKRAVRAWEDYAARDKGPEGDAAHERDLEEILKPDSENGIKWEEWQEEEEETDVCKLQCRYATLSASDILNHAVYAFENYLPPSLRDWVDQKLRDLRVTLIENGILAGSPKTDAAESKAVTEARDRLNSAKSDLEGKQNELKGHREDLDKEYGPNEIFRALSGQCIEKNFGEYTYEFCFMGAATQKPMKGGGNTNMGNFVRIETVTVDEDLPADGKGLGSGERYALKFENGQHCWNGPNRSTQVILACAEKDELWKVVEEEKCVYRMEVGTPAVCEAPGAAGKAAPPRDEL